MLDGGDDQKILELLAVRELGVVEHDFLEQGNELLVEAGLGEGLDGAGDLINVVGVGEGTGNNLLDDELAVRIVRGEDMSPQLLVLSLDQVLGLETVEGVLVGEFDQLVVAVASVTLVAFVGHVRVVILAVGSYYLAIVVLIGLDEFEGVLISRNQDSGQSVMDSGVGIAFLGSQIQPGLQNSELVALGELLNKLLGRTVTSQIVEKLLDIDLVSLQVDQSAEDAGGGVGVDLHEVEVDVLAEVVGPQVTGQLLGEAVLVAEDDQRGGAGKSVLEEEVQNLLGVVALGGLLDDLLQFVHAVALDGGLDELEVDLVVLGLGEEGLQVEEDAVVGAGLLEEFDDGGDSQLLGVGAGHLDDDGHVLAVVLDHLLETDQTVLGLELAQVGDEEFLLEHICVEDHSLDVIDVLVALQSS